MMKVILFPALLAVAASATAGVSSADNRIREEVYNRKAIYTVYAEIGKAMLIEFQPGETIDTKLTDLSLLGMGFGNAWEVGTRANSLVLKPSNPRPDTNIIIVTNKRRYIFDVRLAGKARQPTYAISFTYPDDERRERAELVAEANRMAAQNAAAQAAKDQITAASRAKKTVINTDYSWRGTNQLLRPTAAWDDGQFTHLEYKHSGELPLFYKVLPDGTEALINQNVSQSSGYTTVLQEVTRVIRARLGEEVVEIVNKNYKVPEFNETGTSVHGAVRIDKVGGVSNVE
jgi:type IV secretion system protein VirB9